MRTSFPLSLLFLLTSSAALPHFKQNYAADLEWNSLQHVGKHVNDYVDNSLSEAANVNENFDISLASTNSIATIEGIPTYKHPTFQWSRLHRPFYRLHSPNRIQQLIQTIIQSAESQLERRLLTSLTQPLPKELTVVEMKQLCQGSINRLKRIRQVLISAYERLNDTFRPQLTDTESRDRAMFNQRITNILYACLKDLLFNQLYKQEAENIGITTFSYLLPQLHFYEAALCQSAMQELNAEFQQFFNDNAHSGESSELKYRVHKMNEVVQQSIKLMFQQTPQEKTQ